MAVEIFLTNDELAAARARPTSTMVLSDSSDDNTSVSPPPPRTTPSQSLPTPGPAAPRPADPPVAGPASAQAPQLGGAARKSSFGGARAQARRTLVTKHGAPQSSQRPATPRTVVKPEPDDDAPLAAFRALRSEASIADALDPRVEAMCVQISARFARPSRLADLSFVLTRSPYPFDVSIHLEDIRLAFKKVPARPIIKLDIAFRHVDQSASTATVAASTSFPLPVPPHLVAGSLVAFPLDDHLSTHSFHIPGNPSLPLASPAPHSSLGPPRQAPRPDLRDVVIRVSIVDTAVGAVPERLYESATAMTDGSRLLLSGECALRRSAAGSQVVVSWRVELEHDGSRPSAPTDEVLEKWLEQEMRRCEVEWRTEVAERALVRPSRSSRRTKAPPDSHTLRSNSSRLKRSRTRPTALPRTSSSTRPHPLLPTSSPASPPAPLPSPSPSPSHPSLATTTRASRAAASPSSALSSRRSRRPSTGRTRARRTRTSRPGSSRRSTRARTTTTSTARGPTRTRTSGSGSSRPSGGPRTSSTTARSTRRIQAVRPLSLARSSESFFVR